jgi:hypothetical protein
MTLRWNQRLRAITVGHIPNPRARANVSKTINDEVKDFTRPSLSSA